MTRARTSALLLLSASLAIASIARAEAPIGDVTELDAKAVAAAFAKGAPLLENDQYKVHASRREAAGQAEVHVRDTDVIHVIEGQATLVTGGRVVGGTEIAPDEIRGTAIEGGTERTLAKGAVFVIPNGVPHWFRAVEPPVLYYVVKVTAPGATR
jgi:mannose-6-phosphate isomerase-like protein (cupin superfamily)